MGVSGMYFDRKSSLRNYKYSLKEVMGKYKQSINVIHSVSPISKIISEGSV